MSPAQELLALLPFVEIVNLGPDEVGGEGCVGVYDTDCRLYRWGCDLAISKSVIDTTPGAFWVALREAHLRHHRLCLPSKDWCMTETVETKSRSVTITFGCSCADDYRQRLLSSRVWATTGHVVTHNVAPPGESVTTHGPA